MELHVVCFPSYAAAPSFIHLIFSVYDWQTTTTKNSIKPGKVKEKPEYLDQLDSLDPVADYEGRFAARQAEEVSYHVIWW